MKAKRSTELKKDATLLAIAWPDTWCKNAHSWYDPFLEYIGFSKDGFSPVGHAAFVLIQHDGKMLEYYDCGRYNSPEGKAMIRSSVHDESLTLFTEPVFEKKPELKLKNTTQILREVQNMPGNYSYGTTLHREFLVNYDRAKRIINKEINKGPQVYGPFHPLGTNCARFVVQVLRKSQNRGWLWQFQFFPSPLPSAITGHQSLKTLLACHIRFKTSKCYKHPNKTIQNPSNPSIIEI